MKKKIILLALILISGISFVRLQPVTGLIPADMSSYKSNLAETIMIRDGNNLVVSVKAITGSSPGDTGQIVIRLKFTGNTRKEFKAFAGLSESSPLTLELINESTGTRTSARFEAGSGELMTETATFKAGTYRFKAGTYRFELNGKVIGTGYKPQ